MTNPLYPPELEAVIDNIETGGEKDPDNSVSTTGAIGRGQIMPSTAAPYLGMTAQDARKALFDPATNKTVQTQILNDLWLRYESLPPPQRSLAVMAAYNAGPGRADHWLTGGMNMALLPHETQNYLAKGANQLAIGGAVPRATALMGSGGSEPLPSSIYTPIKTDSPVVEDVVPQTGSTPTVNQALTAAPNPLRAYQLLSLLGLMGRGTHTFTPVDYDPWANIGKV